MRHKLKIFLLFLLFFIFCNYQLSTINYQLIYAEVKIVAIVNNEIITQKDLDDFINFTRMQYSKNYKGRQLDEKIQALKPDLLDKLIEDCLILQEAKRNNIVIDESRVRGKLDEIKREYNGDAQFQEVIKREGLVQADIETRIRNQMLMYAIIQQKVKSKVVVRPEEVTDFYNRNTEKFISPEEREVLAVTLENSDLAKSFAFNFKAGQKLEDLAARYPLTVNKISAVKGENLRKEIEEVIFKLGIGEISEPVEIDAKFYVFKLENIIPSKKQSLVEAQDKINAYLLELKLQEAFAKWLDEIKKQSYIKKGED